MDEFGLGDRDVRPILLGVLDEGEVAIESSGPNIDTRCDHALVVPSAKENAFFIFSANPVFRQLGGDPTNNTTEWLVNVVNENLAAPFVVHNERWFQVFKVRQVDCSGQLHIRPLCSESTRQCEGETEDRAHIDIVRQV
jgi:hypothetical protein